jgi:hypothetical protein
MNKLLKILGLYRGFFLKKLPFKPQEGLTISGVINMQILVKPFLITMTILTIGQAYGATPITLEEKSDSKVLEPVKTESVPATKKVAKAPRMATLPNGQKVKIFPGKTITDLPKEVGVQYVTEAGYQKMLKEAKAAEIKPVVAAPVKVVTPEVKADAVPAAPAKPVTAVAPSAPATPITLHPVAPPVQDATIPVKPVDVSALPAAPTPVKAQELADPVPMMSQHPAPVAAPAAPLVTPSVPATPVVVAPVLESPKDDPSQPQVPKVTISVEQRAEMKKQLQAEFDNISIDDANAKLSQKVLEEQQKVEDEIQAKQQAEVAAQVKAAEEAKAAQAAQDEKEYRENAPLAEDNQAKPAKAYTEEELKPIRLDKKNKNMVIELPKQRLNAYLSGAPMPTLDAPAADESKKSQRLEENSDVEEVSGPNYSNMQ